MQPGRGPTVPRGSLGWQPKEGVAEAAEATLPAAIMVEAGHVDREDALAALMLKSSSLCGAADEKLQPGWGPTVPRGALDRQPGEGAAEVAEAA